MVSKRFPQHLKSGMVLTLVWLRFCITLIALSFSSNCCVVGALFHLREAAGAGECCYHRGVQQ